MYLHFPTYSHYEDASYRQRVATGLQRGQADAKDNHRGEGIVIDEAAAVCISMATIESQVAVGVTRVQHGADVNLEGDGLDPAVHAEVPLSCGEVHKILLITLYVF